MRRHLDKFNCKNCHYSWSDAFHRCCGPHELSDALKDWKNWQRDDERRQENRRGRDRRSAQPRNFIADVRCNNYHRAWSELTESKPVNELLMCEPVIMINRLFLDKRYDGQAAPKRQRTNLGKERTNLGEACWVPDAVACTVGATSDVGTQGPKLVPMRKAVITARMSAPARSE